MPQAPSPPAMTGAEPGGRRRRVRRRPRGWAARTDRRRPCVRKRHKVAADRPWAGISACKAGIGAQFRRCRVDAAARPPTGRLTRWRRAPKRG